MGPVAHHGSLMAPHGRPMGFHGRPMGRIWDAHGRTCVSMMGHGGPMEAHGIPLEAIATHWGSLYILTPDQPHSAAVRCTHPMIIYWKYRGLNKYICIQRGKRKKEGGKIHAAEFTLRPQQLQQQRDNASGIWKGLSANWHPIRCAGCVFVLQCRDGKTHTLRSGHDSLGIT